MKEIKIVNKEKIEIIGLALKTSFKNGLSKEQIPPFFHGVLEEGKLKNVLNKINENQMCVFAFENNSPDFTYIMGTEVNEIGEVPSGMISLTMPTCQYASLEIIKRGHEDVGGAFQFITEEWLPKSKYTLANQPGFIYYDDKFFEVFNEKGYEGNPRATVYVPVRKKD